MSKLLLQGSKQQRLKIRRSNTPAKLGADVLDGVIFLGGMVEPIGIEPMTS